MKKPIAYKIGGLATGVIVLLSLCIPISVCAQEANTWQNEITIYGWFAGIDGTANLPTGSGSDISVEASDILDDLEMVLMGGYQGKYNKWSFIADLVYMDVGGSTSRTVGPITASAGLDLKSWIINTGVGYDVVQSDNGNLAVVGGVRYLGLDADVSLALQGTSRRTGSGSEGMLDGIIGLRGYLTLNDNWYIPYYADIGTGGSDLTWQLFGGVAYRFSWGDIRLGYRYLEYDLGDDKIVEDLKLSGPVLGIGFRF
jgi:hypothetical protein